MLAGRFPVRRWLAAGTVLALALIPCAPSMAARRGLTPEDLWKMIRLGSPQASPDASQVVFTAREYSIERNGSVSSLYRVPAGGGEPVRLTRAEVHDFSPLWMPDGRTLLFLSDRSGSVQIWAMHTHGGEPYQVSDLPLDISNLVLAPGAKKVAFSLEVYPDCETLACTVEREEKKGASKTTGRVYTELLFRHWDTWEDGRRSHVFAAPLDAGEHGRLMLGDPKDLMVGIDADSPTKPFGGSEEIAFSADASEIAYAAKVLPGSEPAWSTDVDLFRVPADGSAAPTKITTDNRAWDTAPAYSPDGRWLAHLAMERPRFEADRLRIVLRPLKGDAREPRVLTGDWDRSVGSMSWTPDSRSLVVTAQETGHLKIFKIDVADGGVQTLVDRYHNTSVNVASDGTIFFLQDSSVSPSVLLRVDGKGGEPRRIASLNDDLLAEIEMSPAEDFWFEGAGGEQVHGWLMRPVGARKGRKAPIAFMVHGGPQGAWQDQFHYRWNPQIYAGAGYITLAINFHGSTGYGQDFTDSITGDWGGKPYVDLMKGLDHLVATEDADGERACALGASYGGYMINWIAGHTDRFRCLINHDGIFSEEAAYYTTEELWFPEWEYGGPPWEKPELYKKWSPSTYLENWKTPMLVIHGALDFRLPDTEAFATFTALRRRGIPAKLLHFPDENHWVLKPANALMWHDNVLGWMDRWMGRK